MSSHQFSGHFKEPCVSDSFVCASILVCKCSLKVGFSLIIFVLLSSAVCLLLWIKESETASGHQRERASERERESVRERRTQTHVCSETQTHDNTKTNRHARNRVRAQLRSNTRTRIDPHTHTHTHTHVNQFRRVDSE